MRAAASWASRTMTARGTRPIASPSRRRRRASDGRRPTHDPLPGEREDDDMSAKKGTGLLMVWADVPADREEDFNRWYNEEHLAERLAVPGFLSAARYQAVKNGPKRLACYELESAAVLDTPAYKRVLANPTPWTRRCSPEVIGTVFIRSVYTMIHPAALTPA